jgi:hypothetical protein
LNYSRDGVCAELERLDIARNECLSTLDDTFSDLMNIIEVRKQQLQQQIHKAHDAKNRILSQQLSAIDIEKTKVCIKSIYIYMYVYVCMYVRIT